LGFSLLCCVIAALAADSSAHGKAIAEKSPLTTPTAAQQSSDCGMKGVYQQRAEKHLHRYLAESDFR
jgi:hypothetical protein